MALTPEQNRDEIIAMAREAGFQEGWLNLWSANFERFAALVAAKERERWSEVEQYLVAAAAGVTGIQWQCGQQANGFTASQPEAADAVDAMMLDALKHAQKVLNHHNLPLECGPINEAILAAQREVKP